MKVVIARRAGEIAACRRYIRSVFMQARSIMSRTELVIQLVKIALGVAIGGYFLWWSLEILHRIPPH